MLTLLTLMLASGASYAKDPCKMIRHSNDPLNGPMAGYVNYFDVGHFTALDIQWSKGAWTMHLMTVANGVVDKQGKAGELARLAVGSKVLEFPAREDSPPISNANQSSIFTQWQVAYDLTKDQLTALSSAPVTAIGLTVAGTEYRLPVSAKDGAKLQQAFACAAAM